MDPENPVVKLCVQGMECEAKGDFEGAARLFLSAWDRSADDFERCIAAHYVARHQKTAEEALLWNQRSLEYARVVGGDEVRGFLPSLYLNMGKACEDLGRRDEARGYYAMAAEVMRALPEDAYGSVVRGAVARGLERVG